MLVEINNNNNNYWQAVMIFQLSTAINHPDLFYIYIILKD